jgi:mono/diheme cytochrome c family protein
MKITELKIIVFAILLGLFQFKILAQSAGEGETLFKTRCVACHSIGKGRLVGPDLAKVDDRRSEEWLFKFIKSSQTLIKSGDKDAVALFAEFSQIIMPDQDLSDEQIREILAFIKTAVGSTSETSPATADANTKPSAEEIARGQDLFQGNIRFENNGPSCISCHDVVNDAVIGGGIFAKDLTTVFSRMGGEGVRAILGGPPFPVMEAAYRGKAFNESEIKALVGFLQNADEEQANHQPKDYGWGLFNAGASGMLLITGFFWLIGRHRKKRSVNQDIYDRQIRSE